MNQMQIVFSKLSAIVGPMFLGIVLAVGYIRFLRGKLQRGKITIEDYDKHKAVGRDIFDFISLKALLPFFIIESMLKVQGWTDIPLAFSVGVVIPPLCFYSTKWYLKITNDKEYAPSEDKSFPFLISTFGGGNRGNLFIIALFSTTTHYSDYITYFSALDFGNLVFLLIGIPTLLKHEFGSEPENKDSIFKEYPFIAAGVVTGFFVLRGLIKYIWAYDINDLVLHSIAERKLIFTVAIFFAITLSVNFRNGKLSNFFFDMVGFYSVRILVMIIVFIVLLFCMPLFAHAKIIIFSAIILLLMPPSSFLPRMVADVADFETEMYVNTMFAAFNVIYFICLAVGILVNLSQIIDISV